MKTKVRSVKYYIIRFSPNGTLDTFEKMNDRFYYSFISGYCKKQFRSKDVEYFITI